MPTFLTEVCSTLYDQLPEPKIAWETFLKMCEIPHGSGNVEEIGNAIADWGRELGYEVARDGVGNVLIRRRGTNPDLPGVCLQGHMDMVCVHADDHPVDFKTHKIHPVLHDDGYIRAKGTSLGGDNGIGVGIAMALLRDEELFAGTIEVVATVDEETTMLGAENLDLPIESDNLINIDSEEENYITVGCAGGAEYGATLPITREAVEGLSPLQFTLRNGLGGHSGILIHEGRMNMIKIGIRMLTETGIPYRMGSVKAGQARNVIPGAATFVIHTADVPTLQAALEERFSGTIMREFSLLEKEVLLQFTTEVETPAPMTEESTKNVFHLLTLFPHGVIRMSLVNPSDVQTSINMALVSTTEDALEINALARSAADSEIDAVGHSVRAVAEATGAAFVGPSNRFSGWEPNVDTPLLKSMQKCHEEQYGKPATVMTIHAGLECGMFLRKKYFEAVSVGPDLHYPHSIQEELNVESTVRTHELIKRTILSLWA